MVRLRRLESLTVGAANDADSAGGEPSREAGFFSDPAMDRFAAAFLRLLSEHWVQAEKLGNLVRLLQERDLIAPEELERIGRSAESDAVRDKDATEFVRRILAPLRES